MRVDLVSSPCGEAWLPCLRHACFGMQQEDVLPTPSHEAQFAGMPGLATAMSRMVRSPSHLSGLDKSN